LHEIFYTIATTKLNIEELKLFFKEFEHFETTDIIAFYKQSNPNINPKTVNWRVYSLIQLGIPKFSNFLNILKKRKKEMIFQYIFGLYIRKIYICTE
jgi:hypothetical protein